MRFGRTALAALGVALFSATLLTTPANAEAQGIPVSVDVSIQSRVAATTVGAQSTGCGDGTVCFWALSDYTGSKSVFDTAPTGQWVQSSFWVRSAKNRFGNRAVIFGSSPGVRDRCLNPGSSFPGPFPNGVVWVYVGHAGTRC